MGRPDEVDLDRFRDFIIVETNKDLVCLVHESCGRGAVLYPSTCKPTLTHVIEIATAHVCLIT